jgi:hypothetical protein
MSVCSLHDGNTDSPSNSRARALCSDNAMTFPLHLMAGGPGPWWTDGQILRGKLTDERLRNWDEPGRRIGSLKIY